MDVLPMPAYHLLNMSYYISFLRRVKMSFAAITSEGRNFGCILSSRGCPWDCAFCHNSYKELPHRSQSPSKVINEMKFLYDEYGVRAIFFIEDNLFANHKRLIEISRLIIEYFKDDIVWGANSRVDNINLDVLNIVKKANCKQVTFGWESGSQRILDVLNKRTKVELNYKSVELCNKVGLNAGGTVMINNPGETEEDIRLTQRFIDKSYITGGIGVCMTTPYPGTKLWDYCINNKLIRNDLKWEEFDFHHIPINMTKLDNDSLMRIYNETVEIAIRKFSETMMDRESR
jgi:radical SAM superfamily enzyme YgiQ (UPF0313 family)